MGHFQMEYDKWRMAPSNPNHWYVLIKSDSYHWNMLICSSPFQHQSKGSE